MTALGPANAARKRRFAHKAKVRRVPAGATDDAARETVQASLPCSSPYEMSAREVERAGMGDVANPLHVFTAVPMATVQSDYRLVLGTEDYRIVKVNLWPIADPQYGEMFLEKDGRS